jgi:hypothetical protein
VMVPISVMFVEPTVCPCAVVCAVLGAAKKNASVTTAAPVAKRARCPARQVAVVVVGAAFMPGSIRKDGTSRKGAWSRGNGSPLTAPRHAARHRRRRWIDGLAASARPGATFVLAPRMHRWIGGDLGQSEYRAS